MLRIPRRDATGVEPRDTRRELLRAFGDIITLIEPRLLDLWRSTELTFSQRRLLARLRRGPLSPGALAAELGVLGPTLTRQLAKLEARGLISRAIDTEDRRRVLVALTSTGRRAIAGNRVLGESVLASAAGDLTLEQSNDLLRNLEVLIDLAQRRRDAESE